jgi:D-alanyl-D-alanine carboxypeptidase
MHPRWFLSVLIITIGWRPDVSQADSVDDYIRQQMAERRIPGVALTIIQAGERVKTGCYGFADLEHRVPVTEETVFEIGSVTKQLTAAGVLLLQQEGQLALDDKLTKHFADLPASWTNITVRHLLTHTSGIRSYTGLSGFELTRRLTQKQFLAAFRDRPLNFAPGTSWNYSNTGYSLLGYLIENVSGQNYWDYLHAKIFGPLQMNSTTNREPTLVLPHRAHGYERTNGVWINRDYDLTDVFAAGAVVSTIGDLAKWNAALDRDDLLHADTKIAMWTPATLASGQPTQYGLGWYVDPVDGRKNIGHGGSTSGFSASLQRIPEEQLAVIVLTNTDERIATTLARKLATFYFKQR